MATPQENLARFQEIEKRGLQDKLDPDKRARFDEALKRGLITSSSSGRTPEQTEEARLQRLDQVPELTSGSGLLAGESSAKIAAISPALLTAINPEEQAKIIKSVFPNVGIAHTPEGRLIARNNTTGAVAELNKPGLSGQDLIQALGIGAAFFPSGANIGTAVTKGALGKLAVRSAGTQAAIETVQAASGGEFNPGQVAFEAAAAPISQLGVEKLIKPAGKAIAGAISKKAKTLAEAAGDRAGQLRSFFQEGDQPIEEAIKITTRGQSGDIVEMIQPDIEFYRAADELGISSEPLASFASQNPQFRDIEQALSSVPGSSLDSQGKGFISELSRKADDLIQEYGGSLDKGAVSEGFRQSSLDTIESMVRQADEVYSSLDTLIPKTTPVEAKNTLAFIQMKINELGGERFISPKMRKLLKDLSPRAGKTIRVFDAAKGGQNIPGDVTLPTHELLSQKRREIGQALQGKRSSFQSEEQGLLKALYGRLSSDQEEIAARIGGEALNVAEAAKGLVRQRKQLEDNVASLIGGDLSKSITEVVGTSIKNINKRLPEFRNRIQQIPENIRQEVVVTSLNDIFRGSGVDQQALNVTQFSKFMDELNRQPTAKKALFDALPEASRSAIDNLHKVSKGVSTALGQKIPTGRILTLFNEDNGLLRRLMGKGAAFVTAKAAGGGGPGLAAGAMVGEFLNQKTGKSLAASEMLGSPDFQAMLKAAVREGNVEAGQISRQLEIAEANLVKSATFKKWSEFLDNETLGQILRGGGTGISAYFLQEGE